MPEPTRLLPPLLPLPHGGWLAQSTMTSTEFTIRGLALIPPASTVPVIVVPGLMGTNLKARSAPRTAAEINREVARGAPAWRPPNTMPGATPVLATAPGPLELLPNHLYPGPWLHVSVK